MDDATYDECVDACRAGQYTWCRWTPAHLCDAGVCDGPGAQMITDCAGQIPTVTEWGLITLALALLTAGAVVAYRRRAVHVQ